MLLQPPPLCTSLAADLPNLDRFLGAYPAGDDFEKWRNLSYCITPELVERFVTPLPSQNPVRFALCFLCWRLHGALQLLPPPSTRHLPLPPPPRSDIACYQSHMKPTCTTPMCLSCRLQPPSKHISSVTEMQGVSGVMAKRRHPTDTGPQGKVQAYAAASSKARRKDVWRWRGRVVLRESEGSRGSLLPPPNSHLMYSLSIHYCPWRRFYRNALIPFALPLAPCPYIPEPSRASTLKDSWQTLKPVEHMRIRCVSSPVVHM